MDAIDEDAEVTFQTNIIPVSSLRRTWPQTLQEVEERYGVTLRGTQPNGDGRVPDGPLTRRKLYSWNALYRERRKDSGHHKQVLNWKHLPEDQVATLERSSIWNGGSGLFDIESNAQDLVKISALFDVAMSPQRRSVRAGKESVLGSKRSTALYMALRKLSISRKKLVKVCWALRHMDEKIITRSMVDMMIKSSLWPSPHEILSLKERLRTRQELADPDSVLWHLAVIVPDARFRIKALSFRYDFDDTFESMIRATSLIKSAALEVCTSELLNRLLRIALLVGNRINMAFGGVEARGISVKSLSKLAIIKTSDKTMSVLDCVVTYLDQVFPEAFGVSDDCTCVVEAAKYSLKEQSRSLERARRKLSSIKRFKHLEKFVWYATRKLDDAEREIRQAQASFAKCSQFFCLDQDCPMDTDEFFGYLSDFFQCLDVAVSNHEIRERMAFVRSLNPSPANDRVASSSASVGSTTSKKSIGSTRLSIFTRASSNSATDTTPKKITAIANRKSVFGRMRPVKE